MSDSPVIVHVFQDFDHPLLGAEVWGRLLQAGGTNKVFQSWHWQRAWWDTFGRGALLLVLAEQDGVPVALAPLFAEQGMVFLVGSGGSDYLDFIGDISRDDVLHRLLSAAQAQVPDFLGFRFYHVLDDSETGGLLQQAAEGLELVCFDEGGMPAPLLDMAGQPEQLSRAVRKKSLVRHENYFRRTGELEIVHLTDGAAIVPHLAALFEQHMARWAQTPYPSLFQDPQQRIFYQRLAEIAGNTGWLRFTRLVWQGRPIAFHFGFCYEGEYLWYKPSFDVGLARHSPGEVLLRQLLLAAMEEPVRTFDFGLGDEAFKQRFATGVRHVRTWGLYPSTVIEQQERQDA